MILFWLLVIVAIVAALRRTPWSSSSGGAAQTPLEILKARYARGEIDKKEFEEKKRDLN